MKNIIAIILLVITGFTFPGQTKKDLDANFMLRGYIYAASSIEDEKAPGGYAGSDNTAKPIAASFKYKDQGFFMKIDTSALEKFGEKYNGYHLYIVNASGSAVGLEASDSRLYAIAEALIDNKWQPIEYLPGSWCGNSYHTVYIKPGQFWQFTIPKYGGKIKTKLRYRLDIGKDKFLYSNEITAAVNKTQLTKKEGHNTDGLMDPYDE